MLKRRLVGLCCCAILTACSDASTEAVRDPGASDTFEELSIVTLAPHLAELVFAAGAGDLLTGVVNYTDYPPAAAEVALIGDAFRVDYERIIELQPDLILAWGGGTPAEVILYLQQLGFRVQTIRSSRLSDIPDQVEMIGEFAGTTSVAAVRAAELRAELQQLETAETNAAPLRVFLQISARPWYTVTAQHILDDAIQRCGGQNVFAELTGIAPTVSLESIINANPEVILVVRAKPDAKGWKTVWEDWPQIDAVANDSVYPIDANLVSRAGPRMLAGAAQICAAVAQARKRQVSAD